MAYAESPTSARPTSMRRAKLLSSALTPARAFTQAKQTRAVGRPSGLNEGCWSLARTAWRHRSKTPFNCPSRPSTCLDKGSRHAQRFARGPGGMFRAAITQGCRRPSWMRRSRWKPSTRSMSRRCYAAGWPYTALQHGVAGRVDQLQVEVGTGMPGGQRYLIGRQCFT